ncbi:hypothetical protein L4D09_19575 [Photobacterium makurazakiensis]|uniref:hypothetical protein n=1 Tax=Photobacterium makurazakiensis TaxID=2910234 RepID=UPI003D0F6C2F
MRCFQQVISKLVILTMLFGSVLPVVSAAHLPSPATPMSCHQSMTMSCCMDQETTSVQVINLLECADMSPTHMGSCCGDHNCNTTNIQFAILTNTLHFSLPSVQPIFTEPNGKSHQITNVLLRPPAYS